MYTLFPSAPVRSIPSVAHAHFTIRLRIKLLFLVLAFIFLCLWVFQNNDASRALGKLLTSELGSVKESMNDPTSTVWTLISILLDLVGKAIVSKIYFCDIIIAMVLSTELRQEEEGHDPNVDDNGARSERSKALGRQFRAQSRGRQEMRNAMQVRVRLFVGFLSQESTGTSIYKSAYTYIPPGTVFLHVPGVHQVV
jgi:hypothetical protein